ncbi:MAG: hypothetical protein P8N76_17985 [Pirellulaceae bacterium]|nr:hypothetical protein [Pirellulaceae bacterium]
MRPIDIYRRSENQFVEYYANASAAQHEAWKRVYDARLAKRKAELGEKLYQLQQRSKDGWKNIRGQVEHMRKLNKDERGNVDRREHKAKNKTVSPGGAWLANQMGRKEMIGLAEAYITVSAIIRFVTDFKDGAHAFITPDMHNMFMKEDKSCPWIKGWGRDYNFVAPLPEAQAMIGRASGANGAGLWELEDQLGVPAGLWVKKCQLYGFSIYSYRIDHHNIAGNLEDMELKMPSGFESQAYGSQWKYQHAGKTKYYGSQEKNYIEDRDRYETDKELEERLQDERLLLDEDKAAEFVKGEWLPFGFTSGGMREAVMPKWDREKFLKKISDKVLTTELLSCLRDNTAKVIRAGGWRKYNPSAKNLPKDPKDDPIPFEGSTRLIVSRV